MVEVLIKKYNKRYRDNIQFEDVTEYDIHKFLKPKCKNIFKKFCTKRLFKNLEIKQSAKFIIQEFMEDGDDVYFLSAGHGLTMGYRDAWLSKHINNFTSKQLVMCRDKHLFKCDVLIDDWQENLIKMPNSCMKILFTQPWNVNFNAEGNGMIRVNDWLEIYELLRKN